MTSFLNQFEERLSLPIKLSFTDKAVEFFRKNKKRIASIRLADNELSHGALFSNITFKMLYRLIQSDFVSKIEVSAVEFSSKKKFIMDLTKLIFYEFIYSTFNSNIKELLNVDLIQRDRRNKSSKRVNVIKEQLEKNMSYENLEESLRKNEVLDEIIYDLLYILKKETHSIDEVEKKVYVARNLLLRLSNANWRKLIEIQKEPDFQEVNKSVVNCMYDFLEKAKIADYLAVLLVELLLGIESRKVKRNIMKIYRDKNFSETAVENIDIREKIYKILSKREDNIYIIWKLCDKDSSLKESDKFKITVLSNQYNYKDMKDEIAEKLKKRTKDKTLYEFYRETPAEKLSSELSFLYFTYLNEACMKNGIRFDSHVNKIYTDDFPYVSLVFNFK